MKLFFILSVFLILPFTVIGEEVRERKNKDSQMPVDEFSSLIENRMKEIRDISFKFEQNTYMGGSTQTVSAEVVFSKPDKIRIDYSTPREQSIIYDGKHLYTYVPQINQATKQSKKGFDGILGKSASVIFSTDSVSKMKEEFKLAVYTEENNIVLSAVPINQGNYYKQKIIFSKDRMLPVEAIVYAENLTSVTEFYDYDKNKDIDEEIYKLAEKEEIRIIQID